MLLKAQARWVTLATWLLAGAALAQRDATSGALLRMEEYLSVRATDGVLALKDLSPAILVSTQPRYVSTEAWFPAAAAGVLNRALGPGSIRLCAACMSPTARMVGGTLEWRQTALDVQDVLRLDEATRGNSPAARTAIYLDETTTGVALRVVDLSTGRLVLAESFDERAQELQRTRSTITLLEQQERWAKGLAVVHLVVDFGLFPAQHVSFDWYEQFGDRNLNLAGFSLSVFDPLLGVGGGYFRVIPQLLNLMVGAKVLVSFPTALTLALSQGMPIQLFDPLFTGVLVVRFPIPGTNFGAVATLSTNGRFTLGISLLNFSFLPVLP